MRHKFEIKNHSIDRPHYSNVEEKGNYPYWQFSGVRTDVRGMVSVNAYRYNTGETNVGVCFVHGGREWWWYGRNRNRGKTRKGWAQGVRRAAYNMILKMWKEAGCL